MRGFDSRRLHHVFARHSNGRFRLAPRPEPRADKRRMVSAEALAKEGSSPPNPVEPVLPSGHNVRYVCLMRTSAHPAGAGSASYRVSESGSVPPNEGGLLGGRCRNRRRERTRCGARSLLSRTETVPHLNPTRTEILTDALGRPYFLWDMDMDIASFRGALRSQDDTKRAYLIGKLMRQAKPDDVFTFVTLDEIAALWLGIEPHLGRTREFWRWILERWGVRLGTG